MSEGLLKGFGRLGLGSRALRFEVNGFGVLGSRALRFEGNGFGFRIEGFTHRPHSSSFWGFIFRIP